MSPADVIFPAGELDRILTALGNIEATLKTRENKPVWQILCDVQREMQTLRSEVVRMSQEITVFSAKMCALQLECEKKMLIMVMLFVHRVPVSEVKAIFRDFDDLFPGLSCGKKGVVDAEEKKALPKEPVENGKIREVLSRAQGVAEAV
jgi:hypothetical protein